jgi:hypothetical protein
MLTRCELQALQAAKVEPLTFRRGVHCRPGRWRSRGGSAASAIVGRLRKRGLLRVEIVHGVTRFVITPGGQSAMHFEELAKRDHHSIDRHA